MNHDDDTQHEPACPICGNPTEEDICNHHLANFDMTFPDEGQFGIGLGGGAIYDVEQIGALFHAIQLDCAAAIMRAKTTELVIPKWLKGNARLESYARSLHDIGLDSSSFKDVADFAEHLEMEVLCLPEIRRETIEALLRKCEVSISVTERVLDEMPGQGSEYENWWCDDPKAAAASLSEAVDALLLKRKNAGGDQ